MSASQTVLTHQQQTHLRTLRRGLNRAVTALKGDGCVVVDPGWRTGRAFGHPRLADDDRSPWPDQADLHLLFPLPGDGESACWHSFSDLISAELLPALDFFWPGPLMVVVRCPVSRRRLTLACPTHPLIRELLSRHGPCLWTPLSDAEEESLQARVRQGGELDMVGADRTLVWPDRELSLPVTILDTSSTPWRMTAQGFVEAHELAVQVGATPFLLSEDRAFPSRGLRTFQPQYKTVVLEAASLEELPRLVEMFRSQIRPEWSLRIYLDESVAHHHFPDDRGVRVYGEMSDPERVRRRLEAMLERQRRRSGKRILLIGVAQLEPSADSLKADLVKLADHWLNVPQGGDFEIDEFS